MTTLDTPADRVARHSAPPGHGRVRSTQSPEPRTAQSAEPLAHRRARSARPLDAGRPSAERSGATLGSATWGPSGAPRRAPHRVARHRRPRPTTNRRAVIALAAIWVTVVLIAPHLHASPSIHRWALFGHLAALVLGFGAVLTLDWFGLMWMMRRRTLATVMQVAHGVHMPIWLGLAGLTATGMVLEPDTSAPMTIVKLLAVLAVAVNGVYARRVQDEMTALGDGRPSLGLLLRGGLAVTVSQAGWWTATAVGFLNAQT